MCVYIIHTLSFPILQNPVSIDWDSSFLNKSPCLNFRGPAAAFPPPWFSYSFIYLYLKGVWTPLYSFYGFKRESDPHSHLMHADRKSTYHRATSAQTKGEGLHVICVNVADPNWSTHRQHAPNAIVDSDYVKVVFVFHKTRKFHSSLKDLDCFCLFLYISCYFLPL